MSVVIVALSTYMLKSDRKMVSLTIPGYWHCEFCDSEFMVKGDAQSHEQMCKHKPREKVFTISASLIGILRKYHRQYAEWSLRRKGVLGIIEKIRPIMEPPYDSHADPGDIWNMYNLIKKLKPERVLEYGGGASTFIILLALEENGRGSLLSVERYDDFKEKTFNLIPQDLRSRLILNRRWSSQEADFVYVDDFNDDILSTLSLAKSGTKVLIDGRERQTWEIIDHLEKIRSVIRIQKTFLYQDTKFTLGAIY